MTVVSSKCKHELIDKTSAELQRKWRRIQCLYVLHVLSTAAAISAYLFLYSSIRQYAEVSQTTLSFRQVDFFPILCRTVPLCTAFRFELRIKYPLSNKREKARKFRRNPTAKEPIVRMVSACDKSICGLKFSYKNRVIGHRFSLVTQNS